jgi:hypothetical protein
MQKLLIHTCCAHCLAGTLLYIKEMGEYEIEGLYYNPNIHPLSEFKLRENALKEYAKTIPDINLHYIDYDPRDYFLAIGDKVNAPGRCLSCWQLRLEKTAQFARQNNIPLFTSTLLVSPYQDQEKIKQLGELAAGKYGLKFLSGNFRKYYSQGRKIAKELNLYSQNYCGCIFSEWERYQKKIQGQELKKGRR